MYVLPGSSTGDPPASASATMPESLSGAVAAAGAGAAPSAGAPSAGVAGASAPAAGLASPAGATAVSLPAQAEDDHTLNSPSTSDEKTLRITVLLQKPATRKRAHRAMALCQLAIPL